MPKHKKALCTNTERHNLTACNSLALLRNTRLHILCIEANLCVSPLWLQYRRFQILRGILLSAVSIIAKAGENKTSLFISSDKKGRYLWKFMLCVSHNYLLLCILNLLQEFQSVNTISEAYVNFYIKVLLLPKGYTQNVVGLSISMTWTVLVVRRMCGSVLTMELRDTHAPVNKTLLLFVKKVIV